MIFCRSLIQQFKELFIQSKREIGGEGESLAADYLVREGYVIRDKNFRSRYGEIDLIATRAGRLYFVEVKRRGGHSYGGGLEAITPVKQRRIRKTAAYYLLTNSDCRGLVPFYSVIALEAAPDGALAIEFLPDAFI